MGRTIKVLLSEEKEKQMLQLLGRRYGIGGYNAEQLFKLALTEILIDQASKETEEAKRLAESVDIERQRIQYCIDTETDKYKRQFISCGEELWREEKDEDIL